MYLSTDNKDACSSLTASSLSIIDTYNIMEVVSALVRLTTVSVSLLMLLSVLSVTIGVVCCILSQCHKKPQGTSTV